jgi:hypothetical protein
MEDSILEKSCHPDENRDRVGAALPGKGTAILAPDPGSPILRTFLHTQGSTKAAMAVSTAYPVPTPISARSQKKAKPTLRLSAPGEFLAESAR